ncbi:MAG: hypothetical protein GY716_05535 [bacterium]|nr:hypothetical protein [bacterium]
MHRGSAIVTACMLWLSLQAPTHASGPGEPAARKAAEAVGAALVRGDTSQLRTLLPERGKVQLRLARLGPEEGFFSPGQVQTLLRDFLGHGSIDSFRIRHFEHEAGCYALARAAAKVTDRDGRPANLELHLAFQPEGERWVLRELREAPP